MSEVYPNPAPKADTTDIDLYCLECGYNLRGLSGDPRRCPECGHLNPLEELEIPAKLITTQRRRMETAPAVCVGSIVLVVLGLLVTLIVKANSHFFEPAAYLVCIIPCLIAPWTWRSNAGKFRESCMRRAGWKKALWLYHLYATPLCLVVALMVVAVCLLPPFSSGNSRQLLEAARPFTLLAVVLIIAVAGRWTHRRLRWILEPLQRDVTIALARRELQERRWIEGRGYSLVGAQVGSLASALTPSRGTMPIMQEALPNPFPKPDPADIDLYCLNCGYNLRGLFGDPRRCPECGHLNPVGDIELPASAISAQLRRMETNPAVCVGAALAGAVFLAMLIFVWVISPPGMTIDEFICFAVPTVILAWIWIFCAAGFRKSCRARPGWGGVLWLYHVYALALCLAVGVLCTVPAIVFSALGARAGRLGMAIFTVTAALSLAATLLVIGTLGRRVHRRLKEIMQPLQRELAVNVAREILRRRLARAGAW